ncbi:hypothetical protein, partial [Accumulibacter sp.]
MPKCSTTPTSVQRELPVALRMTARVATQGMNGMVAVRKERAGAVGTDAARVSVSLHLTALMRARGNQRLMAARRAFSCRVGRATLYY